MNIPARPNPTARPTSVDAPADARNNLPTGRNADLRSRSIKKVVSAVRLRDFFIYVPVGVAFCLAAVSFGRFTDR